jgi:hypothetical protein
LGIKQAFVVIEALATGCEKKEGVNNPTKTRSTDGKVMVIEVRHKEFTFDSAASRSFDHHFQRVFNR